MKLCDGEGKFAILTTCEEARNSSYTAITPSPYLQLFRVFPQVLFGGSKWFAVFCHSFRRLLLTERGGVVEHPSLQTVNFPLQLSCLFRHELLNVLHNFSVLLRQLEYVLDVQFVHNRLLLRLVLFKLIHSSWFLHCQIARRKHRH